MPPCQDGVAPYIAKDFRRGEIRESVPVAKPVYSPRPDRIAPFRIREAALGPREKV